MVKKDIDKAIYYFSFSADQNDKYAQYYLGKIYLTSKYFNIDKAIYYYTLAANQNFSHAQYDLGLIYFDNVFIPQNINKVIYYWTLASDNNNSNAQYNLGLMYEEGKYVKQNISKAIHYYKLSAKKNHKKALLALGLIEYKNNDMNMAEYYLFFSAQNGNTNAKFLYGFLKHDGNQEQDINEAIKYYKEASNLNNVYAKNNLGVIYKKGFDTVIEKNLGGAIEYFQEGIHQKNDIICMYNLAHIYFYDEPNENSLDQSIDLLIKSSNQYLQYSIGLLCLAIIKKYSFDINKIKNEIKNIPEMSELLVFLLIFNIEIIGLTNELVYNELYDLYHNIELLYNFDLGIILSCNLTINQKEKLTKHLNIKNITKDFYDGFYE